jgi:hypothetical protein
VVVSRVAGPGKTLPDRQRIRCCHKEARHRLPLSNYPARTAACARTRSGWYRTH